MLPKLKKKIAYVLNILLVQLWFYSNFFPLFSFCYPASADVHAEYPEDDGYQPLLNLILLFHSKHQNG